MVNEYIQWITSLVYYCKIPLIGDSIIRNSQETGTKKINLSIYKKARFSTVNNNCVIFVPFCIE